MKEETWKPVIGYEGLYEVSDFGRVRNAEGHIIKPKVNQNGYLQLHLHKDGKRKYYYVHRLVLDAFSEYVNLFYDQVNHRDENKSNNNLSNLEYCLPSENCSWGKWETDIKHPVRCIETGKRYRSIEECARDFGVSSECISRCVNGIQKTSCGKHFELIKHSESIHSEDFS